MEQDFLQFDDLVSPSISEEVPEAALLTSPSRNEEAILSSSKQHQNGGASTSEAALDDSAQPPQYGSPATSKRRRSPPPPTKNSMSPREVERKRAKQEERQHFEALELPMELARLTSAVRQANQTQNPPNLNLQTGGGVRPETVLLGNTIAQHLVPVNGAPDHAASDEDANQREPEEKSKRDKHSKLVRVAITEYVKEELKPTWKEGQMTKEVYKTIVKKAVDKVTSTLKSHQIPRTQEKVDHFMTFSRQKISKLVQGYVEKYQKPS